MTPPGPEADTTCCGVPSGGASLGQRFVRSASPPPMDRPPGPQPEAQEEDLDQELADMGFLCPITQVLFKDPVVARDGHTYEVHATL